MLKNIRIITIFLLLQFSSTNLLAAEIPIIVISPSKTPQSYNTVGSSVTVIDSNTIKNSSDSFLADVISNSATSTNMFQMGGHGTQQGIQLRGLEKRYSTVYIDGVKMADPASSDNSFYMENIMKHSIDRVEILKGTQSSLYGSNAIGGTIHIFTKKGEKGNNSNVEITNGSNNTKSVYFSADGDNGNINYYLGLNKFITDGISAMNDNGEADGYRNDSIVGSLSYNINDNFKIENSLRLTDSYLDYDAVDKNQTDMNDSTDNLEGSYTLKLLHNKNKFKNTLSYNKTHIERDTTSYTNSYTNYFGYRDALNFLGEYNFNLDNKIVYGIDSEFDSSRYPVSYGKTETVHDESVISQYFDFQFRPIQNLYSTVGLRSDDHTAAGRKTSGRTTLAYQLDGNSKIRSSLGAGVRFPALYDYKYGSSTVLAKGSSYDDLQSERGLSFDLGYDTYLDDLDLGIGITYFKTKTKNPLVSNARTEWVMRNANGINTSEGIELDGNWKPVNKKIDLNFSYTFTDSFDAATCDPEERRSYSDNECRHSGSKVDAAKVRVPRHAAASQINYNVNSKFKNSLLIKYVGETRDFGNTNDSWTDQILTDYITFDLSTSYNVFNAYDLSLSVRNLFDEKYQQAHEYSTLGRTFNFALKRAF